MQHTAGKVECSPTDVGFDESRVDALSRHFERLMDEKKIQGASYCISRRGQVFLHGAVGPRSYLDDATPMRPNDIQFVASMTKVFTATAIMQLVEDGLVRLNQAVGEILPQFGTPPFDKITVFHLLTHSSGMHPDYGCLPNKYDMTYWGALEGGFTLHDPASGEPFDPIAAALALGVRDEPDRQWLYSTFGFVVLGWVIEKVTGSSAHTVIEDRIAAPLGLADTFFTPPPDRLDRYMVTPWFAGRIEKALRGEDLFRGIPGTGGGMSSTPYDLNRFGNAFLNGGELDGARILGRKAVEKMTTPAAALPSYCWDAGGQPRRYGIGWDKADRVEFTYSDSTYCHEGAGYVQLIVDPTEEIVSSVFVPFTERGQFFPDALYGTQNVIWSGLT
ncbi:serine hydrolase domain-containing protein [Xylanimonas sp. McL0601]|uniref:serine hydrolase domain-containing protein n=1 Tax=Xylanimonas sp. McL0601 TaxID=3414739 RepID=UPI003CF183D3